MYMNAYVDVWYILFILVVSDIISEKQNFTNAQYIVVIKP